MNTFFSRFLGLILLIIAIAGILICCVGIFGVWRFRGIAEREVTAILDLVSETTDMAVGGLGNAHTVLVAAADSMGNLDASLESVSVTMDSTTHFFDTASQLTSDTLPNTLRSTQKAIQAAAQSAKLVDDTLSVIASIPLIGSNYSPDQPLSESLKEISTSLDILPNTIEGLNDDVVQIKGHMIDLQGHLKDTKVQTEQIKSSLTEAKDVIAKLNEATDRIQPKITNLREQMPRWFNYLTWGLTIFLAWFAVAQMGLAAQGLRMILEKDGK